MSVGAITGIGFSAESRDGEIASLDRHLASLVDLGVDTAEVAASSMDLVSGGRIMKDRLAKLRAVTRAHALRYTVHGLIGSDFFTPETRARQIAAARAMVQICHEIGATVLVQHSGTLDGDHLHLLDEAVQAERDAVADLAEFAKPYGVRIGLENLFATPPHRHRLTASQVAATVRAVNHPNLMAVIDFSHAYIDCKARGLDFRAEINAMAEVAGHLHLSDSFGEMPTGLSYHYLPESTALGLGDLHMPLGWGDIPWEAIFADLRVAPDTVLIMEIYGRYAAEQAESLQIARKLAATVGIREKE